MQDRRRSQDRVVGCLVAVRQELKMVQKLGLELHLGLGLKFDLVVP